MFNFSILNLQRPREPNGNMMLQLQSYKGFRYLNLSQYSDQISSRYIFRANENMCKDNIIIKNGRTYFFLK